MRVLDEGHIYELDQLGTEETYLLVFIKRSSRYIKHEREWAGLQTQEVLRALIDRTQYLNDLIPCVETQDAIWHLQTALFCYEARAHRRKLEKVNRLDASHDDTERPKPWRDHPYESVPFSEMGIELRPTGEDGHIILEGVQ